MLKMEMNMTIVTLYKTGKSITEIARVVGHDRKTVRRVIKDHKQSGTCRPRSIIRPSTLDPYKEEIVEYLEKGLTAIRIHEELKAQGSSAKYRTVSHYIQKLRDKKKICVRFHSNPGEEAQIDFGYVGMLPDNDGRKRKAWVFNMRLSYSRLDYYEVVFDQKVRTFVECHINAFIYFGGVPNVVKLDNLKAAILEAHFYEPVHQEVYKKFSDHYNFDPIPCRVRKPQEKGKVESGIKYVKNNFFAGRKFNTKQQTENRLRDWLNNKCNCRTHGTTKKIPRELFEKEEKSKMVALPLDDFSFPEIVRRKVCKDCHITVGNNYYSVPFEYVGKIVDVDRDNKLIKISHDGKQVTVHTRGESIGEFITNKSHYPKYKYFTHESEEYRSLYKEKMKGVGCYSEEMFGLILKEQPQSWYRTTKGILSLRKQFADEVVELACKRALSFNISSYSKIKNICKSGAYNLPMENNTRGKYEFA